VEQIVVRRDHGKPDAVARATRIPARKSFRLRGGALGLLTVEEVPERIGSCRGSVSSCSRWFDGEAHPPRGTEIVRAAELEPDRFFFVEGLCYLQQP
jgi:hypothetical protein